MLLLNFVVVFNCLKTCSEILNWEKKPVRNSNTY